MASSVSSFQVGIPPGSSAANPAVTNLSVANKAVVGIRWRVPPGPRGTMGFALAQSGVPVLPSDLGTFIVADDEWDTVDTAGFPSSGAWSVRGWNTGTVTHSVMLQFYYDGAGTPTGPGGVSLTDYVQGGFPTDDGLLAEMWV